MRAVLLTFLAAGVLAAGCKKKSEERPAEPAGQGAGAAGAGGEGAAAKVPKDSYPATADGLRAFAADLVRVELRNPSEARRVGQAMLALPSPEAWFTRVFGPERGKHLVAEYQVYGGYGAELPALIARQGKELGRKHFLAEKFEDPKDPAATGLQARALAAMVEKVPLFSLRMTGEGKEDFVLYNFVHDGTTFRYVGRLTELDGKRPPAGELATLEKRQRDVAAP